MELVGVAGPTPVDQALQLELEVAEHQGVDELAQLLGPEEVAQQLAIERQRRGPTLGQRRVALVHVDGDPPEQQRLGEGRGAGRVDGDDADRARAQVGEDLAQRRQVEDVVEALAGGLEQDREVGVLGGHGEQVGGALALLPQRGAAVGAPAGQQQGPGGALAEARREHRGVGELGDDDVGDLVGVEEQVVHRELVGGVGQAQHDAVVAPHELDVHAVLDGEAVLEGHGPRRVHLGAERREDADAPVADLVAEALDDDGAVVGHGAGRRRGLLLQVLDEVDRGPLVEVVVALEALDGVGLGQRPDLAHERTERPAELERPAGAVTAPERHLARLARRRDHDDALVGDVLDAPGAGAEEEGLARPALVDHLLVELADPGAVGQEHAEEAAVGDGAAAGDGEPLGAGAAPDDVVDAVPHHAGRSSLNSSEG